MPLAVILMEQIISGCDPDPALHAGLVAGEGQVFHARCNDVRRRVAVLPFNLERLGPTLMFGIHGSGASRSGSEKPIVASSPR